VRSAPRGLVDLCEQEALVFLPRSPQILPIPGPGSPEHVEQNILAASIDLEPGEINAISEFV
jgi:aryl-alcohol dehydrogenase-like predicted oxidoreductase